MIEKQIRGGVIPLLAMVCMELLHADGLVIKPSLERGDSIIIELPASKVSPGTSVVSFDEGTLLTEKDGTICLTLNDKEVYAEEETEDAKLSRLRDLARNIPPFPRDNMQILNAVSQIFASKSLYKGTADISRTIQISPEQFQQTYISQQTVFSRIKRLFDRETSVQIRQKDILHQSLVLTQQLESRNKVVDLTHIENDRLRIDTFLCCAAAQAFLAQSQMNNGRVTKPVSDSIAGPIPKDRIAVVAGYEFCGDPNKKTVKMTKLQPIGTAARNRSNNALRAAALGTIGAAAVKIVAELYK